MALADRRRCHRLACRPALRQVMGTVLNTQAVLGLLAFVAVIADTLAYLKTGAIPDTLTLTTTTVIGGLLGSTIPAVGATKSVDVATTDTTQ